MQTEHCQINKCVGQQEKSNNGCTEAFRPPAKNTFYITETIASQNR